MCDKKVIFIVSFFISLITDCQDSLVELPYSVEYHRPKKFHMAKIIDELGYKYYLATENLLNENLIASYHSKNLPRLLLNTVYQMSESIVNSTSNQKINNESSFRDMSFETLRRNTLINLKKSSDNLIKKSKNSYSSYKNSTTTLISIADSYCDQIIIFREYIGLTGYSKSNSKQKHIPQSVMFEKQLGGDGITNEQWVAISQYGPHREKYFDLIKRQKNINVQIITNLRKKEKVKLNVGDPEQISLSSGTVEGLDYTYFRDPPNQLSFLFSYDEMFLKEIINWIVYINSGNPSKLSEIFQMGLGITFDINNKEVGQLSFEKINYRNFIDNKGDRIRMTYSQEQFDGVSFSDIGIHEVHILKNNRIEFIAKVLNDDINIENTEPVIMQINNINGSLLNRIKQVIDTIRSNEVDYDGEILNIGIY